MIIDNREGKHREALGRLDRLQTRFPSNRLLPLNAGTAAIEAKQFDVAE